ncbi:cysteine desulfurase family protein [Brevibacillus choshinensis]|uniref:cysteine desulfurase n=1 Tax=Brevibacillus choshinensis TaxID=54911 RepID=A0ABX7FUS9_BRECH|nr:cysteine desulfurase family protein [Brevibacillus choshinensis]QRG69458.1 cysteine desulfurase [Brevibacillus choshinensis]
MSDMMYFDHAATTPVHHRVVEAMTPYLTQVFGNPSSVHGFGREARKALEAARDQIAAFMDADPQSLIFTGSGTEADNLAIIGGAMAQKERGRHVITSQVEHHAVLHACEYLEQAGFEVTYLPVDETGSVRLADLKEAIRPDTVLVSIMYGNNEVGTIQPIEEIGAFLREKGIIFHTDAVQAFGVLPVRVRQLPVDMLSVSAHKINGPKGVGALYVAKKVPLSPIMHGGSQERKRRAGTENLAGIVGFAEATRVTSEEMDDRVSKYRRMKEEMEAVWKEAGIAYQINGHPERVLPHVFNVSFIGVHTETMLMNLDLVRIAASSGSACTSGSLELSHVLTAMNLDESIATSAIRFSFGITNTIEEAKKAAQAVASIVKRLVK